MSNENQTWADSSLPIPPMSPELLKVVTSSSPTQMRKPLLRWLLLITVSLTIGTAFILKVGVRPDLSTTNLYWIAGSTLFWALGFLVLSRFTIFPKKGSVLPSFNKCLLFAVGFSAFSIVLGYLAPFVFDGLLYTDESNREILLKYLVVCFKKGMLLSIVPIALGIALMRKTAPLHSTKLAFSIGACGGALAGLTLNFQCPMSGSFHLSIAHGLVIIGAALLAMLGSKVLVP